MALVIRFTVGNMGAPADGAISYYNPILAGKRIKVFREGVFQYGNGVNYKMSLSGSIVFIPKLSAPERVAIIST